MPRALVTGGAGFIGSHLADRMLAAGYETTIIDNLSSGNRDNIPPAARFVRANVQSPDAAQVISEGRFDVIAHLAAQADVRKSVSDPREDLDANVSGTLNLLEAVRAQPEGARPRFVFSSTGGALYGAADVFPTPETWPTDPDSPYGVGKLAAEYYVAYYARVWELDTAVLRFANVFGPRQDPCGEAGVVAIFSKLLSDGAPLSIYGTGEQTRDYVYVSDAVDALFSAATRPLPAAGPLTSRVFNIGTGVETSVIALATLLSSVANRNPQREFKPSRAGEVERSLLDATKASAVLGWKPRVSLEDGLALTYKWVASANSRRASAG